MVQPRIARILVQRRPVRSVSDNDRNQGSGDRQERRTGNAASCGSYSDADSKKPADARGHGHREHSLHHHTQGGAQHRRSARFGTQRAKAGQGDDDDSEDNRNDRIRRCCKRRQQRIAANREPLMSAEWQLPFREIGNSASCRPRLSACREMDNSPSRPLMTLIRVGRSKKSDSSVQPLVFVYEFGH